MKKNFLEKNRKRKLCRGLFTKLSMQNQKNLKTYVRKKVVKDF